CLIYPWSDYKSVSDLLAMHRLLIGHDLESEAPLVCTAILSKMSESNMNLDILLLSVGSVILLPLKGDLPAHMKSFRGKGLNCRSQFMHRERWRR
ncbi:MAG: hypothetical protein ACE5KV_03670, partial [Thermoplasmata archaeon]